MFIGFGSERIEAHTLITDNIEHFTASIIAHYHTSSLAAIFLDCTLGEPHSVSLSHPYIQNHFSNTKIFGKANKSTNRNIAMPSKPT